MLKALLRSLLRSGGYELVRSGRFGKDPWQDLMAMFNATPPQVIFDVGANEGQTTACLAATFPSANIYSFEPFEGAFNRLVELAIHHREIHPVNVAIGDRTGLKTLHVNAASVTNSLLSNAPEADTFQPKGAAVLDRTVNVRVTTIDTFCMEHGIGTIDILKTDTQGYETSVLRGAEGLMLEERITAVMVEMVFVPLYLNQSYFQDVYDHLWRHGFRLVHLYNVHLNEWNFVSWCDALFIQPKARTGTQHLNLKNVFRSMNDESTSLRQRCTIPPSASKKKVC